MSGSIIVAGIGPGAAEHSTAAVRDAVEQSDVIIGYRTYLRLISAWALDVPREGSGMRQEVGRVNRAIDLALEGRRVALISGGDAGIYGMAGLVYEVLRERDEHVDVEVLPGVPALNAAAALLGAPLMNDFAAVSLSDLLTPLDEILLRVEMAARADFVLCLYNPRGKNRMEPLERTCEILDEIRDSNTVVGVVRAAYREGQEVEIVSLGGLREIEVNMTTILIVGNSRTYVHDGKMITPRGYGNRYDLG